jgi:putative hydrolase of the HAD superfamily
MADDTPMTPSSPSLGSTPVDAPLADLRRAETWIFDLDNTLYPASCDLFAQVDVRIRDYIANFLGVEPDEAYRVQKEFFHMHGTSMRGMMENHGMDPDPFLDYVHDIDVTPVPPSPHLDAALAALPGRKIVFTNGSVAHADRVTKRLGIDHHFEVVFDIVASGYTPKPAPHVYDRLIDEHAIDPAKTVMVEDIARNLAPAAALGMTTVWIRTNSTWGAEGAAVGYVHHVIDDLASWLVEIVAGE